MNFEQTIAFENWFNVKHYDTSFRYADDPEAYRAGLQSEQIANHAYEKCIAVGLSQAQLEEESANCEANRQRLNGDRLLHPSLFMVAKEFDNTQKMIGWMGTR